MRLSIITIDDFWGSTEEMLIPKCLGVVQAGHSRRRRLDRLLAQGHRLRGYED